MANENSIFIQLLRGGGKIYVAEFTRTILG